MRELLLTTLEFAVGFINSEWRAFALTMLAAVRSTDWAKEDTRWDEVSAVVRKWLEDVMRARDEMDVVLAKQLRVAAELAATRELKRLNLLQGA